MESKKIKILAIDDNKDNLISLKALIKDEFPDAIAFTALDGTKGIELAAKENPDLILLDIVMPDMDGYEVCQKLKADDLLNDIPVVFITAIKLDKESRIRALECGAEGFLSKPIDESELVAQIRAMVKIRNSNMDKRFEKERLEDLVQKQTRELMLAYKETLNLLNEVKNENLERKKTEKALKMSEERLRMVVDATPFPIALVDTEDNIIKYWSRSAFTLFGHVAPTANEWYEIAYPDNEYRKEVIERWNPFLEKARLSKVPVNTGEYAVTCSDGSVLICELYATFIEDNLVVTFNNITDRKKAEEHLNESHRIIEGINNSIPARVFWKDKNLVYIGCNTAFAIDAGFSSSKDIIGKNDNQMSWSNLAELYRRDDMQVITSGKPKLNIEESLTIAGGKIINLLTSKTPLIDDNDDVSGIIGTYVDITERKKAEEKLYQSYVFSESLLRTIPFGMDIVDESGTVLFQSEQFKNIFGEGAIGKKCWELYRDDKKQSSDCPLLKGITLGVTGTYESHGVIGGRIFEINHTGMLYEGKKALLEIFLDITDKKRIESDLIKAKEKAEESDLLKSAFLANMSHEIRTPMNGILGFTELLKEPNLSTDDQQDYIRTIQISGERMLDTINNIVDVAKIESGLINVAIDETNINKKIEFTYKFFKREVERKGLQFIFKNGLPLKDSVIRTDNEKVYGILTNLVKNAIKFTNEGSIEFGYVLKTDSEVVEHSRNAELEFYVKDTGVGIPKNQQQIIFERFRQGSYDLDRLYEGSGLGLSISKSYVEMLGGKIWVESEENKGTTFYFTIPYNPVEQEKTKINGVDSSEIEEVQMKNLKVLIVEDDEVSYSLLKRTIQKISKEVLHAITGVEAIEVCRSNPDLDLVLMDIRMPIMDGCEATRQIRQLNKGIIIIAQTAYTYACDCDIAMEAGCNDYISKPINMTLLFELIKKHVNK